MPGLWIHICTSARPTILYMPCLPKRSKEKVQIPERLLILLRGPSIRILKPKAYFHCDFAARLVACCCCCCGARLLKVDSPRGVTRLHASRVQRMDGAAVRISCHLDYQAFRAHDLDCSNGRSKSVL